MTFIILQAAQKDLHAECGENMDTWIVSRNPTGVYKPPQSDPGAPEVSPEFMEFDHCYSCSLACHILLQSSYHGRSSKAGRRHPRLCLANETRDRGTG
jgi:hypothetical protein